MAVVERFGEKVRLGCFDCKTPVEERIATYSDGIEHTGWWCMHCGEFVKTTIIKLYKSRQLDLFNGY